MPQPSPTEFDELRRRLGAGQRELLGAVWEHYRDQNQWIPCRLLHQRLGKAAVQTALAELGGHLARAHREEGQERYRLTFLGVLLTKEGAAAERLLIRYLQYVRDRYRADPHLDWIGSREVEAVLGLGADESRLLQQLIRLSHWWGGGSAFGGREWTVGVPIDVDELPAADLEGYVRSHVLTHFPLAVHAGSPPRSEAASGGAFRFVADARLREQLAADWHEAQDVCHVRGWKSCVILCGGILEALLTESLQRADEAGGEKAPHLPGGRTLPVLLERAARRGLVQPGSFSLAPALRAFRRLIGPGRPPRGIANLTRSDAEAALEAVRGCLQQLGRPSGSPAPPGGR